MIERVVEVRGEGDCAECLCTWENYKGAPTVWVPRLVVEAHGPPASGRLGPHVSLLEEYEQRNKQHQLRSLAHPDGARRAARRCHASILEMCRQGCADRDVQTGMCRRGCADRVRGQGAWTGCVDRNVSSAMGGPLDGCTVSVHHHHWMAALSLCTTTIGWLHCLCAPPTFPRPNFDCQV